MTDPNEAGRRAMQESMRTSADATRRSMENGRRALEDLQRFENVNRQHRIQTSTSNASGGRGGSGIVGVIGTLIALAIIGGALYLVVTGFQGFGS